MGGSSTNDFTVKTRVDVIGSRGAQKWNQISATKVHSTVKWIYYARVDQFLCLIMFIEKPRPSMSSPRRNIYHTRNHGSPVSGERGGKWQRQLWLRRTALQPYAETSRKRNELTPERKNREYQNSTKRKMKEQCGSLGPSSVAYGVSWRCNQS
jgi:hypothetical protein